MKLAHRHAIARLSAWLQRWQILSDKPIHHFGIGVARATAAIQSAMLFEHVREELLSY